MDNKGGHGHGLTNGGQSHGLTNGGSGLTNGDVSDGEIQSTTTISTVAVQAGKAKIVLAILKSHDWIRVRIQQMEPDLMDVGSTLEEAKILRREHDELLTKLNLKERDVTDLLARTDDLALQNKSYQEVYSAMAETLAEAWKDLYKQLEYRKMLLDQSIAFHESALQFARKMEQAQEKFLATVGTAHDLDTCRRLLQQHQDLKKSILESSMLTLQEGQLLLDRIREMGLHADVQNRHATTAACYGIEYLLELLQDRRRQLEDLWLLRKIKLEQGLQLLLLDQEVNKVSDWYEKVGDVYLSNKDLGHSLPSAQALKAEHLKFEQQAREVQETILRLIRTADHLVHSDRADAESVRKRLQVIDNKCENFMTRMDTRRKNLAMSNSFFALVQTALSKLDEIERQLATTDLPKNSSGLAELHDYLSKLIAETTAPALHEGRTLLDRVGRDEPGAQGVKAMVDKLQERCIKLDEQCKARYEAGQRNDAFDKFMEKFNQLNSWMIHVGQATVDQNTDMGANLSSGRDFLELHERLDEDMRNKRGDVNSLSTTIEDLAKSGDPVIVAMKDKVKVFREQWDALHETIKQRIKLALSYVAFHKKAQQLAIQMDVLEEYLKIEKLDPTQVPESSVKHKEENFSKMNVDFGQVETTGKHFIKEATEVKPDERLDRKKAIIVVETILAHFSERKFLITDYYEHWKVHVTTGREFKSQWNQFVQDVRKTIDWMLKEEKELFAPYISGYLGGTADEAKKMQEKVNRFIPIAQRAQDEVEKHLKTAEMLILQGDTKGQRDQIISELLRVHTRFQGRIGEYQTLLRMAIKFFESLGQVDKLIDSTEKAYQSTDLPTELTSAQVMLREHDVSKVKVNQLIDFTADEGEKIVTRVRQQESESVAKDEVAKVLQLTEKRRRAWERTWEDQKIRLEQNLALCQFYFDLRQLHGELDELQRQLNARHGNYGSSLSSVNMTTQAFKQFEKNVQLVGARVKNFCGTADDMIKSGVHDSRRIRHEVDELKRKWDEFQKSIGDYNKSLDESRRFFELMEGCDGWIKGAGQFLLDVGRKATDCKTSQDAIALIGQLENFRNVGGAEQDGRLNEMECIATALYGNVAGPQKMQHIVDRNQEILAAFVKAIEELATLRDNLQKKEHIISQMEQVVERKAPRQPRFVQPLQNAEITEGQRFTFECRLECDTKTPQIEWFKENLQLKSPDYEQSYRDGLCQLTIQETLSEDTSRYLCRATTEAGAVETSAILKVRETQRKVVKPEFSRPLRSADVPEGSALSLECHVSGVPDPTVSWYKDERSLEGCPDYVITKIDTLCTLKVRRLGKEHSGEYVCKAANSGGDSSTAARVQVLSIRKPQFTEFLKDTRVPEGNSVLLQCSFTGDPPPHIQWLHNDKQILPSAVFKIVVDNTYTSLEIKEAFPEDAGSYAVVAKNLGGESRTSALLTVEGLVMNGEAPIRAPGKPLFMTPLTNREVQEGSRAQLKCTVSGSPEPEIIWYHNEKPLKENKDIELSFIGDQCSPSSERFIWRTRGSTSVWRGTCMDQRTARVDSL